LGQEPGAELFSAQKYPAGHNCIDVVAAGQKKPAEQVPYIELLAAQKKPAKQGRIDNVAAGQ